MDFITGAAAIYKKEVFAPYLKEVSDCGVEFAEDLTMMYMLGNNEKIEYLTNVRGVFVGMNLAQEYLPTETPLGKNVFRTIIKTYSHYCTEKNSLQSGFLTFTLQKAG